MKASLLKPTRKGSRAGLTLRERGMLAAFLWALALIGAVLVWQQFRKARTVDRELFAQFETQAVVLKEKDSIEESLAAHVARMQSAARLEGATLQGLVDALARQSSLVPASVVPRSEGKSGVQILSVRMSFNDAPIERLLAFEDRLTNQKIPLFVNRVQIDVGRGDTLRVSYDIATHHLRETEK